jgi:hypothetical protein
MSQINPDEPNNASNMRMWRAIGLACCWFTLSFPFLVTDYYYSRNGGETCVTDKQFMSIRTYLTGSAVMLTIMTLMQIYVFCSFYHAVRTNEEMTTLLVIELVIMGIASIGLIWNILGVASLASLTKDECSIYDYMVVSLVVKVLMSTACLCGLKNWHS